MTGVGKKGRPPKGKEPIKKMAIKKQRGPEWASGLKQLYDSVVDEPLPDAFKDLLSRLDSGKR